MKALTLILSIIALLGAGASGYFYFEIGNTKQELQQRLDSESARASSLNGQLNEAKEQNETMQQSLTKAQDDLKSTTDELSGLQSKAMQLSNNLRDTKAELAAKTKSEEDLKSQVFELRQDLAKTRASMENATPEDMASYKDMIAKLEDRIRGMEGGEEILADSLTPAKTYNRNGIVAEVGDKNSFVVVDLGKKQGAFAGVKFNITRDGEVIAKATISDVQDEYSIAQVTPNSIKSAIIPGDAAISASR